MIKSENSKDKSIDYKTLGFFGAFGVAINLLTSSPSLATNSQDIAKTQTTTPKNEQILPNDGEKPNILIADYRNGRGGAGGGSGRDRYGERRSRNGNYIYENDDFEFNRAVNNLDDAVSKCYRLSQSYPRLNCNAISARVESMKAFARLARLQPNLSNLISFVDEFMSLVYTNTDTLIGLRNTNDINEISYRQKNKFRNTRSILINGDNQGFLGAQGVNNTFNEVSAINYATTFTKSVLIFATNDINSILSGL